MRAHARHAGTKNRRLLHLFRAWVAVLATLFVIGSTSPVYAADTTTDPNAATATTQSTDPAAGTDATQPTDPAADPATDSSTTDSTTPTDPSTTTPDTATPDTSGTTTTTKKTSKTTTLATQQTLVTPSVVTNPDWIWQGSAATQDDTFGDSGGYTNGASEGDPPSGWNGGNSSSPKNDIGLYYFNVDNSSGDVVASFGFTRKTDNGDTGFSVEFNQKANLAGTAPRPNRTEGDLLLKFFKDSGSAPLTFAHAYIWLPQSKFAAHDAAYPSLEKCKLITGMAAGWCEIPKAGFQGRVSDANLTAEGKVDLTTLFGAGQQGCSAQFHYINMRSTASSENWTNAMQDYVEPETREIPSTCATLTIKKYRAGTTTLLTGAHYRVWAGTDTSQTPLYNDLSEGSAADTDPTANDGVIGLAGLEPGTYTVKEIQAPTGYFLPHACDATHTAPNCDTQTITLAKSDSGTLSFYDPKQWQALTASKTASATYAVQYAWQVKKYVRNPGDVSYSDTQAEQDIPNPASGSPSASFQYQVVATQTGATKSDYQVNGTIKVSNPNNEAVTADLTDSLSDATVCSIAGGGTKTIPANAVNQAYAYSCSYASAPASNTGTNTATISWSKSAYPQTAGDVGASGNYSISPTATYTFAADPTKVHDKTVRITDDHNAAWDTTPWTLTGVETAPFTTETRTYSRTVTGTANSCTTSPNTATLKSQDTGNATLSTDGASAKLCSAGKLDVSKNKTVSMTRTYLWQIHKTRTSAAQINSGQSADYSVTVDKADGAGFQDSGWQMTGVITVANPNDWQSITMSSLTDAYSGGGTCAVDNSRVTGTTTWGAVVLTLTASQSRDYLYHCTFVTQPGYNGTNTATATWDAATAHTAADAASTNSTSTGTAGVTQADWELGASPVNKTITVTDSAYTGGTGVGGHTLGTATWGVDTPKTFTYSITWTVATAGTCETKPNTATITETGQDSSASVLVCNPSTLTGLKTATPSFTRTYDFTVTKQVLDTDGTTWVDSTTVHPDVYDHTFSYRVIVQRDGSTDSAYKLSGSITVHNPNMDSNIAPIHAVISEPSTFGGVTLSNCNIDDGNAATAPNAAEVTIASNTPAHPSATDVQLPYTCDLSGKPADSTSNVATIDWDGPGSTTATSAPVTFSTPTTEVDKSVQVKDDLANPIADPSDDKILGTVTWDEAAGAGKTFGPYDTAHTATTTGCSASNTFVNTATAYGDTTGNPLGSDTASAQICPNAPTWKVEKSSDPADGTRIEPGTDIVYALTTTHLTGVTATDVQVVDHLDDVLNNATYVGVTDSSGTLLAPQPPNVVESGNTLTWTIASLVHGQPQTLYFKVHVNADAWNVNLHNLVTSTGSNCPDTLPSGVAYSPECTTDHHTTAKPKLTLVKSVDENGTGATDLPSAWDLSASGPSSVTDVKSGTQTEVLPGTYTLSEEHGPAGYTSQGYVCTGSAAVVATVSLVSDESKTCTVTNVAQKPHLKLVKIVDNGTTGGKGVITDWTLTAAGPTNVSGAGGAEKDVQIGDYDLSEAERADGPTGYTAGAWGCTGGSMKDADTVSVALGDSVTCTITNTAQPSSYTIAKSSSPGDGATVKPGDTITYTLTATRTGTGVDPTNIDVVDHLEGVWAHATYLGVVGSVPAGQSVTAPTAGDKHLTWHIDQLSGTATLQFQVKVNDSEFGTSIENVVSSTGSSNCPSDTAALGKPECVTDHYTPAYSVTKDSNPVEGSRVAPDTDVDYTLTVTNTTAHATVDGAVVVDDLSSVVNHTSDPVIQSGTGGSYSSATKKLTWTVPSLAPGASASLVYRVHIDADAYGIAIHNVATPQPDTGGTCVPTDADDQTPCKTNHDTKDKPKLTLVKVVDNGTTDATGAPKDWTLTATGTSDSASGPGAGAGAVTNHPLVPGDYSLAESNGPAHYTQGTWECRDNNAQVPTYVAAGQAGKDGNVMLPLDGNFTCRVTNTADTGHYTVAKVSDPTSGSEVQPGSKITYTVTAKWHDGSTMKNVVVWDDLSKVLDHATLDAVPTGAVLDGTTLKWTIPELSDSSGPVTLQYTVTVDSEAWNIHLINLVTPKSPNGTCEVDHTCTTDDHTPKLPVLTLVKHVANGLNGTAQPSDWTLHADGPDSASGPGAGAGSVAKTPLHPGDYDLSESGGPSGYTAGSWTCSNSQGPVTSVTLVPNADVTCEITNTQDTHWKVVKTSDPASGSTVQPDTDVTYTLTATHLTGADPTNVVVTDDLSDVVDDATFDATQLPAGATYDATTHILTWNVGTLSTVKTLSYTVHVKPDARGVTLRNVITAPTSDNCPPESESADCTTTHPVPAWTLKKSSDPVTGSEVPVGSKVHYTLTVKNTGSVLLTGATVVDDLSNVLDDASLDAAPANTTFNAITQKLTWSVPDVAPGDSTSLHYTVTINDDAYKATLTNVATPGQPTGKCLQASDCTTTETTPKLPVLTLVKHVANGLNGTAQPTDWTLHADGPDHTSGAVGSAAVTKQQLHPGDYDLSETGGPSGYTAGSWTCSNSQGPVTSVALAPNDDVTCEITNTQDTHWKVVKTSDPASGSTVQPDTDVTYTLTATHLTGAAPTNVVVTDDLSDVVDDASFDATQLPAGASYNSSTHILTWNVGTLSTTKTLSYTVHVNADARGVTLRNVVTGPGSDNCPEGSTSADCTTVHPVPAWTLTKVSDPVTGSKVGVGSTVTYTLTVENTGEVLLQGATVTDDLSQVLNHATLDATPDGATFDEATSTLHWAVPDLEPGDSATLVYSVTIGANAFDISITNVATPDQPTGECVTEGGCTTTQETPPAPEPPPNPPTPPNPPQPGPPPSPPKLPDTGGPSRGYLPIGFGLVILGAGLMLAQSRRRLHP